MPLFFLETFQNFFPFKILFRQDLERIGLVGEIIFYIKGTFPDFEAQTV